MKVTIDFEDLFNDIDHDKTALQNVKEAIHQKAIEYLAMRIGFQLQNDIDRSFPITIAEEKQSELTHDNLRELSKIIVNKYKKKIKEDLKKLLKDSL